MPLNNFCRTHFDSDFKLGCHCLPIKIQFIQGDELDELVVLEAAAAAAAVVVVVVVVVVVAVVVVVVLGISRTRSIDKVHFRSFY